ncbi:hypothetical protein [Streptomyces sp. NPDC051452]|uniref:hypothetical protein n=1 Tax=Streptomyces sp. NPDC051452 TaxID=3365654 RepID=UPI00378AB36F
MADKHAADLKRVDSQNHVTDFVRGVEEGPQVGFLDGIVRSAVGVTPFGQALAARTDFEKRDLDLNEMIDMVEQTDPEDLESSGKALWDARDAIKKAADELSGHIDKVHWVGQSGEAFRTWGGNLVKNTHHLSDFAGAAGDQITAAAVGLASVRGAMPERDAKSGRKRPEKFTAAEKTADKAEYAAAVKVEKDRQEAINQMNRLASYYAVSEEVLSALPAEGKAPEFTSMPDVGVPRPQQVHDDRPVSVAGPHGSGSSGTPISSGHHSVLPAHDVTRHTTSENAPPTRHIPEKTLHPDQTVGTHIDSTAPPPTATPATGHTLPVTGTPPTSGGQSTVFDGPYATPISNRAPGRGPGGGGGFRTSPSGQGRSGASSLKSQGSGRAVGQGSTSQMGRAASTAESGAKGAASGAKSMSTGRGVTGGTPRAGGAGAPGMNGRPATGAGRSNGVVGGRPTTTSGGSAKGGARIPRGTVIGGEESSNSRGGVGRSGQRGVFGASEPTARTVSKGAGSRTGAGTSEAVTGRPTARNSAAGAERNGLTRGGAGLVQGRNGRRKDEEEQQGSQRPDYLVEDEETHLPDKPRRDVPPVVD